MMFGKKGKDFFIAGFPTFLILLIANYLSNRIF